MFYTSNILQAWMNVEKRLRNVVGESLKRSEQFALFIDETESLLMYFALNQKLPSLHDTSMQLKEYLRSPIRIERREDLGKCQEEGDGEKNERSSLCLIFPLVDSSFCRLLLHATCQYHGINCKSVEVTSSSYKSYVSNAIFVDTASEHKNKDIICILHDSKRFVGHGVKLRSVLS